MKRFLFICVLFPKFLCAQSLVGAWTAKSDTLNSLVIATDNYITINSFSDKTFIESWGGKYEISPRGEIIIDIEFHSNKPSIVNSLQTYNLDVKKKNIQFNDLKYSKSGTKDNDLTGLWRITSRANQEGQMNEMKPGPRKTLKIMAGGYFQWFAINTSTREFSGTGGGLYTLADGRYTEKIEFFSRDNSRVGATLSFNADVKDTEWIHSGKSSKGDAIKEIWTKQ